MNVFLQRYFSDGCTQTNGSQLSSSESYCLDTVGNGYRSNFYLHPDFEALLLMNHYSGVIQVEWEATWEW